MISVTLTSYNMGDVTEADYDAWIQYVSDRIDERCGFEVDLDACAFDRPAFTTAIAGATAAEEEVIRAALAALWEEACADNFGAGVSEPPTGVAHAVTLAMSMAQHHEPRSFESFERKPTDDDE